MHLPSEEGSLVRQLSYAIFEKRERDKYKKDLKKALEKFHETLTIAQNYNLFDSAKKDEYGFFKDSVDNHVKTLKKTLKADAERVAKGEHKLSLEAADRFLLR